jgi:hypothetical protein
LIKAKQAIDYLQINKQTASAAATAGDCGAFVAAAQAASRLTAVYQVDRIHQ